MESIRFGVDGWNARYDEGFTAESVARIADAAACAFLRGHGVGASVVVGYDMRSEGRHMAQLASRVMAARGLSVRLSGSPARSRRSAGTSTAIPRSSAVSS